MKHHMDLKGARILQIGKFYPPYFGGIETHLQNLCNELNRRGVHLDVLVAGREFQTTQSTVDGVRVVRAGSWFDFAAAPICPDMVKLIRRFKPDLVHIHLPNPTAVLAYLSSRLLTRHRCQLVVTYHSDVVRQKLMSKAFAPVLSKVLRQSASIIAASPNYLESSPVLRNFRSQCRVIPYGMSLSEFDTPQTEQVAKIRAEHGNRLILAVGRLVYYKGFEYLVRAMQKIDGKLIIVGGGKLRESLLQLASACGVGDRVSILSGVKDVTPYYQAADVFVLPSIARSEAFGLVQLEAMACGVPVVNTSLDSGVPFVSLDQETGLTVPPLDADALAGAVTRLLDDPQLRQRYGQAGRQRAREVFSLEGMVDATLSLYADVLQTDRQSVGVSEVGRGKVGATSVTSQSKGLRASA